MTHRPREAFSHDVALLFFAPQVLQKLLLYLLGVVTYVNYNCCLSNVEGLLDSYRKELVLKAERMHFLTQKFLTCAFSPGWFHLWVIAIYVEVVHFVDSFVFFVFVFCLQVALNDFVKRFVVLNCIYVLCDFGCVNDRLFEYVLLDVSEDL